MKSDVRRRSRRRYPRPQCQTRYRTGAVSESSHHIAAAQKSTAKHQHRDLLSYQSVKTPKLVIMIIKTVSTFKSHLKTHMFPISN